MKRQKFNAQWLSLYWVFDPDQCCWQPNETLKQMRKAIEGGVSMIQWRAPNWTIEEQKEVLLPIKALCDERSIPLIINNEVRLAYDIDASGVHVGQNDMTPKEARALLGEDKYIGLSISSEAELKDACLDDLDYIGIGPIWPTSSKKNAAPALGIDHLLRITQSASIPQVGIGGITQHNLTELRGSGLSGIAVISALSQQYEIQKAAEDLRSLIRANLYENNSQ